MPLLKFWWEILICISFYEWNSEKIFNSTFQITISVHAAMYVIFFTLMCVRENKIFSEIFSISCRKTKIFLTCHGQAFGLDSMPLIIRPCLEVVVVVNNANLGCLWLAKPSLRPQNGCKIFIWLDCWPKSSAEKADPPCKMLLKRRKFDQIYFTIFPLLALCCKFNYVFPIQMSYLTCFFLEIPEFTPLK